MDSGDIIRQQEIEITDNTTTETLHDTLSQMGVDLLLKTIPDIVSGNINPVKQDPNEVTYAPNIKREEEKLDFNKTVKEVYNQIRGMYPFPVSYAVLNGQIIKVCESKIGTSTHKKPGEIINIYKDGIGVSCSDGEIIITKLKPSGKKEMLVSDYLNGKKKEDLLGKIFE